MLWNPESEHLFTWMRGRGALGGTWGLFLRGAELSLRVEQGDWAKQKSGWFFLLDSGISMGSSLTSATYWLCDLEQVTLPL